MLSEIQYTFSFWSDVECVMQDALVKFFPVKY